MESRTDELRFTLNSPNDSYYSGQLISGEFIFYNEKGIAPISIKIQFLGQGSVYWEEFDTVMYNNTEITRPNNTGCIENYVNNMVTVFSNNEHNVLLPGSHNFPFQFKIPETAPSSFQGSKGKVVYSIIATIDRTGNGPNVVTQNIKKNINVVAPLDLNTVPETKSPIVLEFEEVYSCCCTFDPIKLNIALPVSGYCPGQYIPIEVTATNNSVIEVTEIIFQLMQRECYRNTTTNCSYEEPPRELATVKSVPIFMSTKKQYNIKLPVPDILPPNLLNCNIIDVGYTFNVTVKMSGGMNDDQDETEICLGLIPIAGFQDTNYIHPLKNQLPPDQLSVPNLTTTPNNTYGSLDSCKQSNTASVLPYPTSDAQNIPMVNVNATEDIVTSPPPPYNPEFEQNTEYSSLINKSCAPSAPPANV